MNQPTQYEFIDINLNRFDDRVAKKTSWESIVKISNFFAGSANRTFFELSPDRLTIFDDAQVRRFLEKGSTLPNPLWHWLPSIITSLIIVLSLLFGYLFPNGIITEILNYFCIPSLCLLPLVTIAALIFSIQLKRQYSKFPIFDRMIGSHWITKDLQELTPEPDAEILDLSQVYALQLLSVRSIDQDDGREYFRYELNFVLQDATRMQVRGHYYVKDAILADAEQLGSFLDVPVWNYMQGDELHYL